jgi:hypothetical protein
MTPAEAQQIADRAADRQRVLDKFPDGAAEVTDQDCKLLTAAEVHSLINVGRIAGIGPDKRLQRRA